MLEGFMSRNPIRQFEAILAEYQGAAGGRAFWMGRVGLYAVLKALGVRPGDRVGICAYVCAGVVEAVTRLRAIPVFLDVDRRLNISPASLDRLTQPLAALVLQHTFGVPCDLDASLAWADQHSVPVIEDCCHALGATWKGARVGTFGQAAIFSFEWGKPFTIGQGGMVTFPDAALVREVDALVASEGVRPSLGASVSLACQRQLHRYLLTPSTERVLAFGYHWACQHGWVSGSEPQHESLVGEAEGFLRLCSPGQARAGVRQMRRWPETMRRRQDAAQAIRARLQREGIPLIEPDPRSVPMYLRYPIWVRSKERALAAAEKAGVDLAGWYTSPAHPLQGEALTALGYVAAECPTAEQAFASVVTLPTWPAMSPAKLEEAVALTGQWA
jgi:perosamine synthetase